MINLTGYKVMEEISKSGNSSIFKGTRVSDNQPVIVKLLTKEHPSNQELSAYIREYEIMEKIACSETIKPYELVKYNNSMAIVMEDIGGESVAKILQSFKPNFAEKLALAILMTDALIQIHKNNIIHKDINPTNFIWNRKTNQVKIIDFGFSSELTREVSQNINTYTVEGTINYISPEQTGKINRQIDNRADLYSLGITFYEIFTGQLPFHGEDESELIYCHIAEKPIPPVKINPEVSNILSDIIMKLVSKIAGDRYQSAVGLRKDLEYCRQDLELQDQMESTFIPGQQDISDRFEIPQKLYGREAEIDVLLNSFEKAANGSSEFLLVSGYSGVGKSSLIHEVRKPIIERKGYFAYGKFDQLERNIPYYGITQAFKELLKLLLSETKYNLEVWRQQLLEAVGSNGQIIIDILPELEQIIGPQPQVSELYPLEAGNRFKLIFNRFINVFVSPEHPLVIFLDDLQWSDVSTLDLIRYLLTTGKVQYVLFLGAYRENEVYPGHYLYQLIEDFKKVQLDQISSFQQIYIKPLELNAVNLLMSETFHIDINESEPLSRIIFQKTKGNPLFINQLLNLLYLQGTFAFQVDKGYWNYDLERIELAEVSDNVVDFLVEGMKSLPEETMDILKLASCIGTQFDLATVSLISKKSVESLGKNLWIAITKEIILPLNNNYRFINILKEEMLPTDLEISFCFAHDRIQQAVTLLIPEEEKCEIHLGIGLEYLKSYRENQYTVEIFDLVNHLNIGRELICNRDDRIELVYLNTVAGNKANKSTAFAVAFTYFETAKSLLSEEEWSTMPDKLFDLLLKQASNALLSGDLLNADTICKYLLRISNNKLEKGAVSNIIILLLIFQGKLSEAIDEARTTLLLFDIAFPESYEEIVLKMQEGIAKMQQFLASNPALELVNLPVMQDPEKAMAMQLLFQVVPPAIQVNPLLCNIATLMMFELTMNYGTTPLSCKCFADCGVIQGTALSDYETGYKLGKAALALISKFNAETQKSPTYFVLSYISHWRTHYQEALDYYDMSYRTGLETGDLMHASFAIAHKVYLSMWVGKNLPECKLKVEEAIAYLQQGKGVVPLLLAEIIQDTVNKLQTIPEQESQLDFETKDTEMMEVIKNSHNVIFLCRFYIYNTYVNVILGNMEEAEKWNTMAEANIFALLSDFPLPDHYLFKGLILIHKWNKATVEEQKQIKEALIEIQQRLKNWAENCPENFAHKYYLLSAEMAIVEHQSLDTIIELFHQAKDSIGSSDFIQFKALCNELYGKFWLSKGDEIIAKAYIREAYYLYEQWGAYRKNELMKKQYSYYLEVESSQRGELKTKSLSTVNSIDMNSILKSTRAISSEIKIEKLLTILIRTLIENAGAQGGSFLSKNEMDGQFYVEAEQNIKTGAIQIRHLFPFTESKDLCIEIVQYVTRTRETVVIHDASSDINWQSNQYIKNNKVKSVLCFPIFYQNQFKAVVYLENNLCDNVFTSDRLEILNILSSQASISIENAKLYVDMEEKVLERTFQLNNANEKLHELSLRDTLTNLYNRRYFFEFANDRTLRFISNRELLLESNEIREEEASENVLGVFLVDIDHFKEVNDTYGHSVGDNVLVAVSGLLKQIIRGDDLLVRWGGEEFLIILYDTNPEFLDKFARKILKRIEETPIEVSENETIYKTCSLGYVEVPLDATNPNLLSIEQVVNISDYALYHAKENGRNCAAQFKTIKPIGKDENLKKYLANLSKSNKLNEEYFKIEFYKNSDL